MSHGAIQEEGENQVREAVAEAIIWSELNSFLDHLALANVKVSFHKMVVGSFYIPLRLIYR